jgi:hypothetical protein
MGDAICPYGQSIVDRRAPHGSGDLPQYVHATCGNARYEETPAAQMTGGKVILYVEER